MHVLLRTLQGSSFEKSQVGYSSTPSTVCTRADQCLYGPGEGTSSPQDSSLISGLILLLLAASFISEKGRKMLPTPVGTHSGTSLLGPSLLDGNSRDSFVSRSLADVAEVSTQSYALIPEVAKSLKHTCLLLRIFHQDVKTWGQHMYIQVSGF